MLQKSGEVVDLTSTEVSILYELLQHRGEVVSKRVISTCRRWDGSRFHMIAAWTCTSAICAVSLARIPGVTTVSKRFVVSVTSTA